MRGHALLLGLVVAIACAHSTPVAAPPTAAKPPVSTSPTRVPEPSIPEPTGDRITLSRTACYGWCPVFTVTLFTSGVAVWQGEQHVATVGEARAAIDPARVEQVLSAIEAIALDGVPSATNVGCGTDMGGTLVKLSRAGTERIAWIHDGFLLEMCDGHGKCTSSGEGVAKRLGLSMEAMRAVDDLANEVFGLPAIVAWVGPLGE